MKKLLSVILTVFMLSAVAFGAEYSITENGFNRVDDEINIRYSGNDKEYMTVFVYDVTKINGATNETPWDVENTPIIGLDQAVGNGTFDVKVKPEYTGDVVIVLGGELGDSTKVFLHIENGVPEQIIDAEYNAGGDTTTVGNGKTITIQQGTKLLNATVSTTGSGKVIYTNDSGSKVDISGEIFFNGAGEIDAASEKTIKLMSNNTDRTTYNVGFVNKTMVTADKTKYIVELADKNGNKKAQATYDLNCLQGEVRVRVGAKNVPLGTEIIQTIKVE